jgi:hypothetical protein
MYALSQFRGHVRWLGEHHREDLMASRRFSQMNVRFQADSLEIGDVFGGDRVVEVFGDRIGVAPHPSTIDWRG